VLGMTGALLPMIGQNFGASELDRVRSALFLCWKIGFIMAIFAMPALWFGGRFAMGLFSDDAEVIAIGASYLRVDSFLFPIYMMLFSINSFLQGLKRPIWTLWISIYRQGIGIAGWFIALIVAQRVARQEIGGLRA